MVIGARFLAIGMLAVMAVGQTALAADVRLFVRHDVADFGAWKKGYDSHADWQKKMGVFNQAVYQSTSNPNDVTVIHDFHSLEEAKVFLASAELKDRMDKIGVNCHSAPAAKRTEKTTVRNYTRRGSNPQPSVPKTDALSN